MALQEEFEVQGNFLFRYRGIIPVLIFVAGLLAYANSLSEMLIRSISFGSFYNTCCFLVTLFGFAIRIYTVGYAAKNTSGRNTKGQVADSVNTTGIYSLIRHPLYVGNFFMWLGMALLSQDIWFIVAFIFMYWVYYERIMFAEEQYLRKKFGTAYLSWAANTPSIIPDFKNYRRNKYSFNAKRVVCQEKTGFMLVFLLYFLFEQLHIFVVHDSIMFKPSFWLLSMCGGVLTYITIKTLEKSNLLVNY